MRSLELAHVFPYLVISELQCLHSHCSELSRNLSTFQILLLGFLVSGLTNVLRKPMCSVCLTALCYPFLGSQVTSFWITRQSQTHYLCQTFPEIASSSTGFSTCEPKSFVAFLSYLPYSKT